MPNTPAGHMLPLLSLLLILSSRVHLALAFSWIDNFRPHECYDIISSMPQNCSDTADQVCQYDDGGALTNAGHVLVTYDACERLCGDGYGLLAAGYIVQQVSYWVIPAVVVVAHFHFAPLGGRNMACVVAHMLADPIDSLWSLLTRIAVHRRLLQTAVAPDARLKSAGAIATIWAAYDELGFDNPSRVFLDTVWERRKVDEFFLAVEHGWSTALAGTMAPMRGWRSTSSLLSDWFRRLKRGLAPKPLWRARGGGMPDYLRYVELLPAGERRILYHVETAAQRLVFNRSESSLTAWIAIIGLLSALTSAYVRTWDDHISAYTISVFMLLSIALPIVKLSSNIGASTSSTAPVDILQTLRRDLATEFPGLELFPPLRIPTSANYGNVTDSDIEQRQVLLKSRDDQQLKYWPRVAAFSGMNSSYRPEKTPQYSPAWLSLVLLGASVVWVLGLCYVPAIVTSYFTPRVGFGCGTLNWTLIASCWTASLLSDVLLRKLHYYQKTAQKSRIRWEWIGDGKNLWRVTCWRDFVLALFIFAILNGFLLGLNNSCFCMSWVVGGPVPAYVDIFPLTPQELAANWLLWATTPPAGLTGSLIGIVVLELVVSDSRKLLNRGRRAREQMLLHLRALAPQSPQLDEQDDGELRGRNAVRGVTEPEQGTKVAYTENTLELQSFAAAGAPDEVELAELKHLSSAS